MTNRTSKPFIAGLVPARAVPSLYWWGVLGVGVMVVICAWEAWRQYRASGRFSPLYAVIAIWAVSYLAYQWHSLRREPAAGTLATGAVRSKSHRRDHIAGVLAKTAIWTAILFAAVLVVAIYENGGQPRGSRYPDSPVPQLAPAADGGSALQQAPADGGSVLQQAPADGALILQQEDRMHQGSAARG